MLRAHRHPAVTAGLATSLVALPQVAQAASLLGSSEELLRMTVPPFLIGCVTGLAAGGIVSLLLVQHNRQWLLDDLAELDAQAQGDAPVSEQPAEQVAAAPVAEEAPAKAPAPVAAEAPAPATVEEPVAVVAEEPAEEPAPAYVGKHFKPAAAPVVEEAPVAPVAVAQEEPVELVPEEPVALVEEPADLSQEIASAPMVVVVVDSPQAQPAEAAQEKRTPQRRGSHLRAQDWENTGTIRVQSPEDSAVLRVPEVETEPPDYGDVAEQYVRRLTFRERMAVRARGVAAVLAERLSGNKMDGVPIIVRADGTTGDVGTPWWEAAVGDRIRRGGLAQEFMEDTAHKDIHEQVRRSQDTTSTMTVEEPDFLASEQPGFRSVSPITSRVAQVDEGVYPEVREYEDVADEDEVWARALAAMDERVKEQIRMSFEDIVGGADTIDEPEGLEPATSFIPFKTPAGHPEVVDTETYVDYLLKDEFAQSSSKAARHSSRRYLKVIEGGSTTSFRMPPRHARPLSESRDEEFGGLHFAAAKEA